MNKEVYTNSWKRKALDQSYPDIVKEYIAEVNFTVAYNEALNALAAQGHCVEYILDEEGDKYMKSHFVYNKRGD